jgi:uncharacterized caspase-like protein
VLRRWCGWVEMPEKKALLIGVSHYGEGLVPIPSALRDVDALAKVLRDPALGGFDAEAVRVLPNPARTEMEDAVEYFFRNSSADDLLLLYFSGHGLRDEHRQLFLTCRETGKILEGYARGCLREATALSAGTVHRYMELSPSKRQLVILDCCFSGAIAIGMSVKDEGSIDLYEVLGGEGRAVLTSSAATELSFAGAILEEEQAGVEQGLSIYTRFLVEGIRTGAADRHRRGYVDAEDLHDYVKMRLSEVNPAQTPEFYPIRTGYRIVVSRVPRDPTVEYRKQVQSLAEGRRGVISPAGRKVLDNMKHDIGLTEPEAEAIEAEVLQPFLEYEDKLQTYRQALEKTVAALPQPDAPLSSLDCQDLALLESNLKLGEEDVLRLHKQLGIQHQSNMEIYSKSKAVSHLAAGPVIKHLLPLITARPDFMLQLQKRVSVKYPHSDLAITLSPAEQFCALFNLRLRRGQWILLGINSLIGVAWVFTLQNWFLCEMLSSELFNMSPLMGNMKCVGGHAFSSPASVALWSGCLIAYYIWIVVCSNVKTRNSAEVRKMKSKWWIAASALVAYGWFCQLYYPMISYGDGGEGRINRINIYIQPLSGTYVFFCFGMVVFNVGLLFWLPTLLASPRSFRLIVPGAVKVFGIR